MPCRIVPSRSAMNAGAACGACMIESPRTSCSPTEKSLISAAIGLYAVRTRLSVISLTVEIRLLRTTSRVMGSISGDPDDDAAVGGDLGIVAGLEQHRGDAILDDRRAGDAVARA